MYMPISESRNRFLGEVVDLKREEKNYTLKAIAESLAQVRKEIVLIARPIKGPQLQEEYLDAPRAHQEYFAALFSGPERLIKALQQDKVVDATQLRYAAELVQGVSELVSAYAAEITLLKKKHNQSGTDKMKLSKALSAVDARLRTDITTELGHHLDIVRQFIDLFQQVSVKTGSASAVVSRLYTEADGVQRALARTMHPTKFAELVQAVQRRLVHIAYETIQQVAAEEEMSQAEGTLKNFAEKEANILAREPAVSFLDEQHASVGLVDNDQLPPAATEIANQDVKELAALEVENIVIEAPFEEPTKEQEVSVVKEENVTAPVPDAILLDNEENIAQIQRAAISVYQQRERARKKQGVFKRLQQTAGLVAGLFAGVFAYEHRGQVTENPAVVHAVKGIKKALAPQEDAPDSFKAILKNSGLFKGDNDIAQEVKRAKELLQSNRDQVDSQPSTSEMTKKTAVAPTEKNTSVIYRWGNGRHLEHVLTDAVVKVVPEASIYSHNIVENLKVLAAGGVKAEKLGKKLGLYDADWSNLPIINKKDKTVDVPQFFSLLTAKLYQHAKDQEYLNRTKPTILKRLSNFFGA